MSRMVTGLQVGALFSSPPAKRKLEELHVPELAEGY